MKYISILILVTIVGCSGTSQKQNMALATEGTSLIDIASDIGTATVDVVTNSVDMLGEDLKEVGGSMTGPVGTLAVLTGLMFYARKKWRNR